MTHFLPVATRPNKANRIIGQCAVTFPARPFHAIRAVAGARRRDHLYQPGRGLHRHRSTRRPWRAAGRSSGTRSNRGARAAGPASPVRVRHRRAAGHGRRTAAGAVSQSPRRFLRARSIGRIRAGRAAGAAGRRLAVAGAMLGREPARSSRPCWCWAWRAAAARFACCSPAWCSPAPAARSSRWYWCSRTTGSCAA